MARDDFSARTKHILARRVAFRCSNPDCRKITSGPHTDPSRSVSIGVAAHISAAAPGGPRYDPGLSAEDRKSIDNGIWLCQDCARLVDSDIDRFGPEVLLKWKKRAEEDALAELGAIKAGLLGSRVKLEDFRREAFAFVAQFEIYSTCIADDEETRFMWLPDRVPDKIWPLVDGVADGLAVAFCVHHGLSDLVVTNGGLVPEAEVDRGIPFHVTVAGLLKISWTKSYSMYHVYKIGYIPPDMGGQDVNTIRHVVEDIYDLDGNYLEVGFQQAIALHLAPENFSRFYASFGEAVADALLPHEDDLALIAAYAYVYGALAARAQLDPSVAATSKTMAQMEQDSKTIAIELLSRELPLQKVGNIILYARRR